MARKLISIILFLLTNYLMADVVYEKLDEKDYADRQFVTVTINNSIEEGDYEKLNDVLNEINHNNYRLKEDSIYLNSNGGLIDEAKNMGHLIRKHHHATKINKDDNCESACIFLLVAGSCRMALGGVGLHRSRTNYNFEDITEIDEYYRDRPDDYFLEDMGADQALIDASKNLPNWDMRYMTEMAKFKSGLFSTPERESQYWQEVVSRKIAAPKQFLLSNLTDRSFEIYDSVTWYDKWIRDIDPAFVMPTCSEQMFLDQLEQYPNGTDKWDEKFQYYHSYSGYQLENEEGKIDTYYKNEVPLLDDVSHFWTISYYKKGVKEITYKEVTTLAKPTEWSSDETILISLGGRQVERNITVPNTGLMTNGWTVDPKIDPTGPMTVKIYVDDELIKEFNYEVISRKDFEKKVKK